MKKVGLVKIGGNILESQQNISTTISQLNVLLYKLKKFQKIIIIPGGGEYANFVRYIDNNLSIGDTLAHWEAILAMDKNAENLHRQFPLILLIDNFSNLYEHVREQSATPKLIIFQPFFFLYNNNELPHDWNVTSDSIALYLAFKLKLNICYLIKDIDGIFDNKGKIISLLTTKEFEELKKSNQLAQMDNRPNGIKNQSTPIDSYCLQLVERYGISCVLLNGASSKDRIVQYFTKSKNKICTKIKPTK